MRSLVNILENAHLKNCLLCSNCLLDSVTNMLHVIVDYHIKNWIELILFTVITTINVKMSLLATLNFSNFTDIFLSSETTSQLHQAKYSPKVGAAQAKKLLVTDLYKQVWQFIIRVLAVKYWPIGYRKTFWFLEYPQKVKSIFNFPNPYLMHSLICPIELLKVTC